MTPRFPPSCSAALAKPECDRRCVESLSYHMICKPDCMPLRKQLFTRNCHFRNLIIEFLKFIKNFMIDERGGLAP